VPVTGNQSKVVVLGVGNELLKDEGIGVHIARKLQEMSPPGTVEVVDGGTLPDATLVFEGIDKLIVVDAVQAGGKAGAIYRFHPEDVETDSRVITSLHQISLLENLWLMEHFSRKPKEVIIIGIEPEDISSGLELSARLQKQVPQIIALVLKEAGIEHTVDLKKGGSW
jgi:hydrogenase maturation protease